MEQVHRGGPWSQVHVLYTSSLSYYFFTAGFFFRDFLFCLYFTYVRAFESTS